MINEVNNNGATFQLDDSFVNQAAEFISNKCFNEESYRAMCFDAYATYKREFDWAIGESRLIEHLNRLASRDALLVP
ncbi:hypothetical protein [Arcticibacter sp. MXS-1]|uniref:hypothetical protein n=1 Tax=Arcticibacter sp. MXS-1 TaxID=3341726 RepID=UPI0035A97C00